MVSSPSYHHIKIGSKIYKNYKKECNVRDLSRLHFGTFAGDINTVFPQSHLDCWLVNSPLWEIFRSSNSLFAREWGPDLCLAIWAKPISSRRSFWRDISVPGTYEPPPPYMCCHVFRIHEIILYIKINRWVKSYQDHMRYQPPCPLPGGRDHQPWPGGD